MGPDMLGTALDVQRNLHIIYARMAFGSARQRCGDTQRNRIAVPAHDDLDGRCPTRGT